MLDEFQIVIPKLTESHRFYHNIDHITRMLAAHEQWKYHTEFAWTPDLERQIYLAILYHDSIYNIKKGAKSNEELSAEFFMETTQEENRQLIVPISSLIKATEFHFSDKEFSLLASYFLDLDLMQLCTSDIQTLVKDNENIDKEYLTEFDPLFVYESRYNFISGPMKEKARLRNLKNPILARHMQENINYLETIYKKKF